MDQPDPRAHWSVEHRNHWRRDANLGEDQTRLANLALIRSVNLRLLALLDQDLWMPAKK